MHPSICTERVNLHTEQLRDLKEEKSKLQMKANRIMVEMADSKMVETFLESFDMVIKKGDLPNQRKHLIHGLVPKVVVYAKEEIEVYFRAPLSLVRVVSKMAPQCG